MKFTKTGSDQHGAIWTVSESRVCIGRIQKWHGLFIAFDVDGRRMLPACNKRSEAAAMLLKHAEFGELI